MQEVRAGGGKTGRSGEKARMTNAGIGERLPGVTQAPEQLGGVVLAGGRSLRMGRDKAWLQVGGGPLLLRQIGLLTGLGIGHVAIAAGPEDRDPLPATPAPIPLLRDLRPGLGPLAGVERGLRWARGLRADPDDGWTLVLAVDLPEMSADWLRRLITGIRPGSGCVPRNGGRLEPLAAIYPNRSWTMARAHLDRPPENPKASAQEFCRRGLEDGWMTPWDTPPEDHRAMVNWNTPADWTPPGTAGAASSVDQP